MDDKLKLELQKYALKIRMAVIEGTYNAKSGHPGGSLSIADIMAYLYAHEMHVNPQDPNWEDRDRLVLSKGHTAPALYGALALQGFFPLEEIPTLRKPNSRLQGHPSMRMTPGVDMSTGSLGQGISSAVGMALGAKLKDKDYRVYTILGDGEIEEGEVWEAAMFASAKHLDNLVAIVDNNNLQIDGTLEEVNSPYPIDEKFAAFGWYVTAPLMRPAAARASPPSSLQRRSRARGSPIWNMLWNGMAKLRKRKSILRPCLSSVRSWQSWTANKEVFTNGN